MKKKVFLFLIGSLPYFSVKSQESSRLLDNMIREDSTAITALALYPDGIRKNILESCTYPEILVRMESLQKNTSESFRKMLEGYPKEEQQKVWDISRYPGLISKITEGGKKNSEELNKIASDFPQEIRETAVAYGVNHYDLLVKANSLNTSSEQAFESLVFDYPEAVKNSLGELLKHPEIIKILTSDMKMSVLVGDIYKKQPQLIQHKLDSISAGHARQNAKDLEDWKNGLEKNPEAKAEMENASKEFAKEQGYKDNEIGAVNEHAVVNYVIHPYPYWFGYPWWYDYPYWYPYPYWYDWGFYYGPAGIIYIGFPSPFFTHWYFHHPHHHYHYNHFSDYCLGHYYGHRKSVAGFNREVSGWVKAKEQEVPRNFFANDSKRPDRIKELGKLEVDYNNAIKDNPGKKITHNDFLNSNPSAYPNISPVLTESKPKETKPVFEKPKEVPVYNARPRPRPTIIEPRTFPPAQSRPRPVPIQPQALPKSKPQPQPQPRPTIGPRKSVTRDASSELKDDFGKMNEALDYHRSNWDNE